LLRFISVDLVLGIAGQLGERCDVLIHRHGPLFQILKLFLLQLDHSLGNMLCMESSPKFWPVDAFRLLAGFHISIPPVGCMARELVGAALELRGLLTVVALNHLQLLLHLLEPIVSIHWLHGLRKGRRLSALKLSKPIPRWREQHLRWISLHVDQGLLHGLKHLCLHN
jgi:hypothetical protein